MNENFPRNRLINLKNNLPVEVWSEIRQWSKHKSRKTIFSSAAAQHKQEKIIQTSLERKISDLKFLIINDSCSEYWPESRGVMVKREVDLWMKCRCDLSSRRVKIEKLKRFNKFTTAPRAINIWRFIWCDKSLNEKSESRKHMYINRSSISPSRG